MADDGFLAFLGDELSPLGSIRSRKMFGGATLYCDGLVFAIVVDDTLYLKADAELVPRFEAEGAPQFSYETRDGRHASMCYWRAPEALLDDTDLLLEWSRASIAAARRLESEKGAAKTGASRRRKKIASN